MTTGHGLPASHYLLAHGYLEPWINTTTARLYRNNAQNPL